MMLNEVLQGITYDPVRGALDFRGIRYMLIRPETITTFQKAAEERLGVEAATLMFKGGETGGGATARKLHQEFGLPVGELAPAMCRMGTDLGWGAFRVTHFDPAEGRMEIEVINSAYAWAYGSSSDPVCHFILGVFAAVAEVALGGPVTATELGCIACGGDVCRFSYQIRA